MSWMGLLDACILSAGKGSICFGAFIVGVRLVMHDGRACGMFSVLQEASQLKSGMSSKEHSKLSTQTSPQPSTQNTPKS